MKRPQISIAGLVLIVFVAAIGLAAIRGGSAAWSGAVFSIMAFAMICSLLGVALTRSVRRVYWSGFASLGWSYLLLIYVPWLFDNVGQFLLAPNLFAMLEENLHPDGTEMAARVGVQSVALFWAGGAASAMRVYEVSPFQRIGFALEALLWAYLGGWVARYFASGREPADRAGDPSTTTRAVTTATSGSDEVGTPPSP